MILAAQNGEKSLRRIFKQAGNFLGMGVSGLIQVLNPTRIIISGEGVRAGDLMFESMHKAIQRHSNRELYQPVEIIVQKWQDTDWAHGAASLVLQELFKSPFYREQVEGS